MAFAPTAPEPEPPPERPRSVTLIGWTFLVLALSRLLVDSLSLVVWKLGNAESVVTFFMPRGMRGEKELVLRHLPAVLAAQAAVAACVAFIAYHFLRLRAWARPALAIVCGLAMTVLTAIAIALALEWRRLPAGSESTAVAAVIAALLAVDVLLGATIRTVRRPDVRAAFRGSA